MQADVAVGRIGAAPALSRKEERQVVVASTLGTLFEWYDFFIYGTLAVFMSQVLFPQDNPTVALLAALGALAVGFIIRPLGAVMFGYLGDKWGRKYTFLITVVMMGGATVLIGCLPTYQSAGHLSWILLLTLRVIQGLAVGGEYGGAVIYVAEHCEPKRRGLLTGWIQITSSAGLILSLVVILCTQASMSADDFRQWGWRLPFILSIVMLAISIYVRAKLHESPVFTRMKQQNRLSKNPIKETFGQWSSMRLVLLALIGVTAGQGATYFTGQFYVMIFLQQAVQLDQTSVYTLILIGFIIGAPTFVLFGWLSDRIGRKWIMMAGLFIAAIGYHSMFEVLLKAGNPALAQAMQSTPVRVHADTSGGACDFGLQAAMIGSHADHKKVCVQAKKFLVSKGVNFEYAAPLPGQSIAMSVGGVTVNGFDKAAYAQALGKAGYPDRADPARVDRATIILILVLMTAVVAMVYGPVASYLVELFPARIRYTALSFPYHIGAGIFGGIVPFTATYLAQASGNIFGGLMYPVVVMVVVGVIGSLFLPNTRAQAIDEDPTH
ncbi:MFS transporter [Achromobacter piechaudii]|uniref:Sialic acid transporter NanT n=1 Tax=Achromobacter piechaudii TaxID=72556 RepID=A0ABM8KZG3_9BURK|nr:MFS transporter [Achromobacter piechaudii]KNY12431.1 MFS transporter [Achromobacter piechaudii]CAB3714668.1 Sialic acid transporter NanT [Achromobacter piechaudii]CAB3881390.1 Sialic acid transporter NanT [Achromobacter piechaudii]CAB3952904.1 Sialic acid transporter NanT [Achromobacter piechaudii]